MELILLRHSITQGNLERRFIGSLDQPLAEEGITLAKKVAPNLPPVEHIYRSPLLRCQQTASLLWANESQTVIPQLRETDFGIFEGKNHQELQNDPQYLQWISESHEHSPEFGESPEEVADRALIALSHILSHTKKQGFQRVAVVSHGGSIMALLSQVGRPIQDFYQWNCGNCQGFLLEVAEDGTLLLLGNIEVES